MTSGAQTQQIREGRGTERDRGERSESTEENGLREGWRDGAMLYFEHLL